jgi:hypothetical protein
VWGLDGELLSKWKLPPVSKQWEGMALERCHYVGDGGLHGLHVSGLWLHPALDSLPQVWTFAVQEAKEHSVVVLPDCALICKAVDWSLLMHFMKIHCKRGLKSETLRFKRKTFCCRYST